MAAESKRLEQSIVKLTKTSTATKRAIEGTVSRHEELKGRRKTLRARYDKAIDANKPDPVQQ
jgi:hypothetical protein